jgi:large subunit ribosomal protein L7/L12
MAKAKSAENRLAEVKELLNSLTLLEAAQLAKELQEEWGVSAAPAATYAMPVGVAAAAAGEGAAAPAEVEEKEAFDVVLEEIGPNKIQVIKVVRELAGLGLREAKDAVEAAPHTVLSGLPKAQAEDARAKLADAGAKASVK